MTVQRIDQLTKKDIPLYYRNEYTGLAVLEILGNRLSVPIDFSVEVKSTGERVINVRLSERIDYPLLPVIRLLKEKISIMEKDGSLR